MAPHDLHRPFKRPAISDQERRREQSLLRQAQSRQDAQRHARFLASAALSLPPKTPEPESEPKPELVETEASSDSGYESLDIVGASTLSAAEARKWFAKQLMHPEWMIDIPNNLAQDWSLFFLSLNSISSNLSLCFPTSSTLTESPFSILFQVRLRSPFWETVLRRFVQRNDDKSFAERCHSASVSLRLA